MTGTTDTIRVVIPLTIRKRNGRPKILLTCPVFSDHV